MALCGARCLGHPQAVEKATAAAAAKAAAALSDVAPGESEEAVASLEAALRLCRKRLTEQKCCRDWWRD